MKVLLVVLGIFSFFAGSLLAPQVHADTFVSVTSETSFSDSQLHSIACVTLNDQTQCYSNVGSLQVQSIDDNISIGLVNRFETYE
jgi:hypothetical protein